MIPPEGGEIYSSMEPGVRAIIYRRTFDETAKAKIRVSLILFQIWYHVRSPAIATARQ